MMDGCLPGTGTWAARERDLEAFEILPGVDCPVTDFDFPADGGKTLKLLEGRAPPLSFLWE